MSETLHKGWLTTRDGEKYAPATLVENVYTRSGKPYDDRVREYIQSIQSGNETSLTPIRSTLEQHLEEIKKLQAKDKSIEEKLVNFNGDANNDTLYIIDSQDRVIAYVDGTGVNSVDFTIPGLTSLSSVQNNINTINSSLTEIRGNIAAFDNIKDDGNDTLYIIDDQNRVIAYIDNLGMHSINFYVAEGQPDYLTTLQTIQENIDKIDGLQKSLNATNASLTNFIGDTNSRLKNFSGEDDNILFFIDNQDRVIAYIDAEGIHSTTILISEDIKYVKSSLSIKNHSGNEVAYVDDDGVHSTNFLIHNSSGTLVRNLVDVIAQLEKIDSELSTNLTTEQNNRLQGDAKLQSSIDILNDKTKNLDSADSNTFFIIDGSNQVVAYIDATGINAINVTAKKKNANGQLETIGDLISHASSIANLQNRMTPVENGIKNLQNRVNIQEQVTGETTTPTSNHKKRLDDIDALLGTASGNPGVDGTHEARLDTLTSASSNHEQRVTALESWKTSHLGDFSNYSSEVNANLQLLNNKTKNLDAFDSDTFFIIDNENNVIAYIDSTGIVTTDLTTKGFKYNNETKKYILDSNGDFNSVNSKLVELLNNVIDLQNVDTTHNARLTSIESQLANVSNVMDFIGAFTTLNDLNAYLNPNNGDVAIVTNTATEYVYVTGKGWVELGNSTATSTAIANLQSVIGHEGGLNSGEANHHTQLAEHETEITNLQNWQTDTNTTLSNYGTRLSTHDAILGETTTPASGKDHKSRLDNLDNLVGTSNDSANWDGTTHEAQINALKNAVGNPNHGANAATGHELRLDNLEANLTSEITNRTSADSALSERIDTNKDLIDNVNKYFGNFDSDALYILDKDSKVVALIDSNGLTTTNITLKTSQSSTLNNVQDKSTMTFFSAVGTVTFSDDILL